MDFLVNDRSLHGQFHEVASFREALGVVMTMRAAAQRFGRAMYCHRNLLHAQLGPELNLQQAVHGLPREQQSAVMLWVTRHGPFWDDLRQHRPDDWLEWRNEIVTDTAIGEAAFANLHDMERHLVSFAPSVFTHDPVVVDWVREDVRVQARVPNHWDAETLQRTLEASPPPIASWADLETVARARFGAMVLAEDAFEPLAGHPFVPGAAERLVFLLAKLDRLRQCFDAEGGRTAEGHEIYRDFFTGKKGDGGRGAMFSDSSDTEKCDFANHLCFPHPDQEGAKLFCPWHGKVQTPQLRVHFSTPISADKPLYVVYVGPKITKR